MVQLHNGEIWFELKPAIGSTFYFQLPIAEKQSRSDIAERDKLKNKDKIYNIDQSKSLENILNYSFHNDIRAGTVL